MSVPAAVANGVLAAAGVRAHTRFRRSLRDPSAAQQAVLRRLVADNADTAFGVAHGFRSISGVDDYRRNIPVRDFDELRAWLAAVERGEAGVLTTDRVEWLEPSGGSSGASKLVPYTRAFRAEVAAAALPWLVDLYRTWPVLRTGRSYWSVSPPVHRAATTCGGVRIGAAGDDEYFPRPLRGVVRRGQAVDADVADAEDMATCRRRTLDALLRARDLAFVSVWSPTFLTRLVETLDEHWDDLRRRHRLPVRPPQNLGELWPRLALISCWADSHAARAVPAVRDRFPGVAIQPKGLLATEGVVSIPLHGAEAPVAAVRSHFLEFLADGNTYLVDELDTGGTYEVVLSTGGGLYRYRLGDLVRVEGRLHATPLLRFVGRGDGRVDLAGEKLSPAFVEQALRAAEQDSGVRPSFALLAPAPSRRGYVLTVDVPATTDRAIARDLATALEAQLSATHHYRLARDLGQLDAVAGRVIPGAERAWETARLRRGQRAGAIKPTVLSDEPFEEIACAPTS